MKWWNKETRNEYGTYYRQTDWSVERPADWSKPNFTNVAPPDDAFEGVPHDWNEATQQWDESAGADVIRAEKELSAELLAEKLLPMLHDLFKQLSTDGVLNVQGANVTDQTRSDFVKLQNIVSRMRA